MMIYQNKASNVYNYTKREHIQKWVCSFLKYYIKANNHQDEKTHPFPIPIKRIISVCTGTSGDRYEFRVGVQQGFTIQGIQTNRHTT